MTAAVPRDRRDAGSVMPMVTILITFLMIGGWALLSASQQWNARREAHAVAAAAARAGAQGDSDALRTDVVLNPEVAVNRAQAIVAASGYIADVTVLDETVIVNVTVSVDYAFPAPGFPTGVSGTASAVAARGVIEAVP